MKPLDEIMSGEGAAAPEAEQTQNTNIEQTAQAADPVENHEDDSESDHGSDGQQLVPLKALKEERKKVRKYTDEVAEINRKFAELNAKNQTLIQLLQNQQPSQQPVQNKPEAPSLWEDPDAYVGHAVSAAERRLQARILDASFEDAREQDQEKFDQAFQTLEQAVMAGDTRLRDAIVNSPNPGKALLRWHQELEVRREMGNDPVAYKQKLKAELLAEMQAQQTQQPAPSPGGQSRLTGLPSSFSQTQNSGPRGVPQSGGPKPLSEIMNR